MNMSQDTGWFQIPSNIKKVYVGWKNLKFNTLTGRYQSDDVKTVVVTGYYVNIKTNTILRKHKRSGFDVSLMEVFLWRN